ncbi:hypothetical protein DSM3645_26299 [Blastopirellula marina DSM 3645]|uniref:Uncharacterized protein n=1 Tax=Blastopirellula marina DSM 3645 TaxID=314230 RepID=A3ZWH3_9BACT|nr:hypothetical protein DSM3645_26299 [Blastopirellula marina DSM 3645]
MIAATVNVEMSDTVLTMYPKRRLAEVCLHDLIRAHGQMCSGIGSGEVSEESFARGLRSTSFFRCCDCENESIGFRIYP